MNRRGPIFDLKKAEAISLNLSYVARQSKVVESILIQLNLIKQVLQPEKLTLFIIDPNVV